MLFCLCVFFLFFTSLRAFVDAEVMPFVHEWDEAGTYPPELHEKAYQVTNHHLIGLFTAAIPLLCLSLMKKNFLVMRAISIENRVLVFVIFCILLALSVFLSLFLGWHLCRHVAAGVRRHPAT